MPEKNVYEQELLKEKQNAARTQEIIIECLDADKNLISNRRADILNERKYFIDYFYDLHIDEMRDLLENEFIDVKSYEQNLLRIKLLGRQVREPYFAKFIFEENGGESEPFYIGTGTVRDPKTKQIVVYDWRAPVANMYYECDIGNASFTAPDGVIEGNLTQKRRFTFKKGELIKYIDINMPSDDEFLMEILSKNAGSHLRPIIDTLQAEQNKIVRDYIEGVSVISGCAGSGKTSVALHKVAYIIYVFRETIKDKKIIVLSPNDLFSEYISTILPDLGEENVIQMVQENIIAELLEGENVSWHGRYETSEIFAMPEKRSIISGNTFKSSETFSAILREYASFLGTEKGIFKPDTLYLDPECSKQIEEEKIAELFFEKYKKMPLFDRAKAISETVANEHRINDNMLRIYIAEEIEEMFGETSVETLYRKMFVNPDFAEYLKNENPKISEELNNNFALSDLAPGEILWNDACAMAYLTLLFSDNFERKHPFYLIVDEAQDLSYIMLEIINTYYSNCNTLYAGDIAQLVVPSSGNFIDNIRKTSEGRTFRIYNLNTNYRSTRQICEFASDFLPPDMRDIKCIRDGEAVKRVKFDEKSVSNVIDDYISQCFEKGYESVAVICESQYEADKLSCSLSYCSDDFHRVSCLSAFMAKGLEFDCVAVVDRDGNMKKHDNSDGTRLFYTACTRALHELCIVE